MINSIESEHIFIGSLIDYCNNKTDDELREIDACIDSLKAEMFSDELARKCFCIIRNKRAASEEIDFGIVGVELGFEGVEHIPDWLDKVKESITGIKNTARKIKECYGAKRLVKILNIAANSVLEGGNVSEERNRLIAALEEENTKAETESLDFHELESVLTRHISDYGNPEHSGLKTGFSQLDRLTGGLPKTGITILAGRTSEGKSTLALDIAVNVMKAGGTVAYFSCEDSEEKTAERFISRLSGVSLSEATTDFVKHSKNPSLGTGLSERIYSACLNTDWKGKIYLWFEKSATVSLIRSKCNMLSAYKGKIDLVVVDYIQILEPERSGKNEARYKEIGDISRELNKLSGKLNSTVLVLAQLARTAEDGMPKLSDLRESGNLEQDAECVLMLHRFDPYTNKPISEGKFLTIAKCKSAARDKHIKMDYKPEIMTFSNDKEYVSQAR